jgi:Variant SH3 domain
MLQRQNPAMMSPGQSLQNPSFNAAAPPQQMQRSPMVAVSSNTVRARVLFNFSGDGPNQMKLTAGETIEVITRGPPGGWCTGVRGAFPTDYVEVMNGGATQMGQSHPQSGNPLGTPLQGNANTGVTSRTQSQIGLISPYQVGPLGKSASNDDSGKIRIDISPSTKPRTVDLTGLLIQEAPTTPMGSLLDLDSDIPTKLNSVPSSKVQEFDIYNSNVTPALVPQRITSLLDLDEVDILQPQTRSNSGMKLSGNGMSMTNGGSNSLDAALDGLLLSSHPMSTLTPTTAAAVPARQDSSSISKNNSFASMASGTSKIMSSFDKLDIFGDSGTADKVIEPMTNNRSKTGMEGNSMVTAHTSAVSSMIIPDEKQEVVKSEQKPPPVAARVIPPSMHARAIYTRESEGPTELSLECGDFILVETKDSEWWYGSIVTGAAGNGKNSGSRSGFFPGNYVELVDSEVVAAALISNPSLGHAAPSAYDSMMQLASAGHSKASVAGQSLARGASLLLPELGGGLKRQAVCPKFSPTFVCSTAIGENIPIWRHPIFADFFVDIHVPHAPPPAVNNDSKQPVITNYTVKKMSVALRFVSVALQRARETFVNSKNKISTEDEVRNEYLSQVLLHGIGVFSDGSKLCEKLPANTGANPLRVVVSCVERNLRNHTTKLQKILHYLMVILTL